MIGIIGALSEEVEMLINMAEDKKEAEISGISFITGKLHGKKCVVAQCGIGKVNAAVCAQTMVLRYKPDAVINCGVAGALRRGLKTGDIVVARDVVQYDMDTTEFGDRPGLLNIGKESMVEIPCGRELAGALIQACSFLGIDNAVTGRIATGDRFISKPEARAQIHELFEADACEMEGGAIAQACRLNGTPFAILRSISDSMDENSAEDYFTFKMHAAQSAARIISAFFERLP